MANDMTIMYGIFVLFVAVGSLIPMIQAELGSTTSTSSTISSTNSLLSSANTGLNEGTGFWGATPGVFSVLKSIASMFLWTFGALPLYIDLFIFVPLRLIAYAILARNIWIGGGG